MKEYWQKSHWNKALIIVTGLLLIGLVVSIIGGYIGNYYFSWVGVGDYASPTGLPDQFQRGKTLWDWMELLIVPIALALAGYFFSKRQKEWELTTAKEQRDLDLEIAKQERETERQIAQIRAEELTLQNYLDKMTELLLAPNNLRDSLEDSEVRTIARARTLSVLRGLNGKRKGNIMQFLNESRLVSYGQAIIDLAGANLEGTNLRETDLEGADLRRVNLGRADMREVNLERADLRGADLRGADLTGAFLAKANLGEAILVEANLERTDLTGANLKGAILIEANLVEAILVEANLLEAVLQGADLKRADLREVTHNSHTQWPDGFTPNTEPIQTTPSFEESQPTPTPAFTQKAPHPPTGSREAASPPPVEQAEEAKADEDSA